MKKKDPQFHQYQKRRQAKLQRYKARIKNGKVSHPETKRTKKRWTVTVRATAPRHFSLLDNPSETLCFFNDVNEAISKASFHDVLYFDLSNVVTATPDAFMYIIAIMHNNQRIRLRQIKCTGNEPINQETRKLLNEVGFFQYVESAKFHPVEQETKRLRIYRGNDTDNSFAQKMSDFVASRVETSVSRVAIKRLYAMLIELMGNTRQHAFNDNSNIGFNNWYSFAEENIDNIRFVFLDTGVGIPSTIRKRLSEKLIQSTDAAYIASALRGENRTETGAAHRGTGLPEIYNNARDNGVSSLQIVSCRGRCLISNSGNIEEFTLPANFKGTLYSWTINKEASYE